MFRNCQQKVFSLRGKSNGFYPTWNEFNGGSCGQVKMRTVHVPNRQFRGGKITQDI